MNKIDKSEKDIAAEVEHNQDMEEVERVLAIIKSNSTKYVLKNTSNNHKEIRDIEKYSEIKQNIIETNILREQVMISVDNREGIPIIKTMLETIADNNKRLEEQIVEYLK